MLGKFPLSQYSVRKIMILRSEKMFQVSYFMIHIELLFYICGIANERH